MCAESPYVSWANVLKLDECDCEQKLVSRTSIKVEASEAELCDGDGVSASFEFALIRV
jgi:hypothetical protein